jgi:hypothetical protein
MKHHSEVHKHGDTIPGHTGMGLTKEQISFLKEPKGMQEIATKLFGGDYWAANHFQNKFIGNNVLTINEN